MLIADDNPVNRLLLETMMRKAGIETRQAANGLEALSLLEGSERFDLVLMDCQMPLLDGYEATRRWRALEARRDGGRRQPIVAVTAHVQGDDHQRAFAAGMDAHLAKPIDRAALFDLVARWLPAEEAPA